MLFVTALYQFVSIEDPEGLRQRLLDVAHRNGIFGTVIVAREGINGTVSGTQEGLQVFLDICRSVGCVDFRLDPVESNPFKRIFVHAKDEIVTMGVAGIDPNSSRGTYVEPQDWNEIISDPEILVVDTRNDFECNLGSFEGAENPRTTSFREFPDWAKKNAERLANVKGIAMFCTGGIRCEKATSYLSELGIETTYHLKGGILRYLREVPERDSHFRGDCFVFDDRIAVGHGLETNPHVTMCYGCRHPVTHSMREHEHYEEGVSCPSCFETTTDVQKAKFRMRSAQFKAEKRGEIDG